MKRIPNPDRGPQAVFTFAILLTAVVAAAAIAYCVCTAPWAQGCWETVR